LFECKKGWEEHWQGMPEFTCEDLMPVRSVIVHFESLKDMDEFSKLIGQKLTKLTKSIWYPKPDLEDTRKIKYVHKP
jgi:hypothetical protein